VFEAPGTDSNEPTVWKKSNYYSFIQHCVPPNTERERGRTWDAPPARCRTAWKEEEW